MEDDGIEPSVQWLEKINEEFKSLDVPHKRRPWDAWMAWAKESETSLGLNDPSVKRIFSWFEENTKEGSQNLGSMYVGTLYYDTCFWPLTIPVIAGSVRLNAYNCLKTMPLGIKQTLQKNAELSRNFVATWMDCIDYGFEIDPLLRNDGQSFFWQLIKSADQQLNATVTLLHERTPNPKAMESARMATEMFLKAFLVLRGGLSEQDARKKIGHDLRKAIAMVEGVDRNSELQSLDSDLWVFPEVGDRYSGKGKKLGELWLAYQVAQFAGATLTRTITGRDTRSTLRQ